MQCPACDGAMRPWMTMPIDAKKDRATPFGEILRCRQCGLARSAYLPRTDQIAELYDLAAYYTHGESHIREVRSGLLDRILVRTAWQADRARPFEIDMVASSLPAGASILDIGCGDGEKLEAFRALGFDVLGIDPDPRSRAFVADKGLTALDGTAEDPPAAIEGSRFDLVILSHALEHCRDPARALATVGRLMAPGGMAYIEVPNAGCHHFETFRHCSEMFDAPRHLWFFTADALRRLATRNGLAIDRWHYNGFTRLFTPSWRGWECEIFDRLKRRGAAKGAVRHSRLRSFGLLARSAFAGADRKYDSIGIMASHADAQGSEALGSTRLAA